MPSSATSQYNCHPTVNINSSPVPLDKNPKILGVVFDPMFTFSPHISSICAKAASRLQVMKALAGTSWGQDKETLLLTYNSIIKPILTYASPVWYPATSNTNITKLQTIQNNALRITTGCVLKTDMQHLHSECQILPISVCYAHNSTLALSAQITHQICWSQHSQDPDLHEPDCSRRKSLPTSVASLKQTAP